MLQAMDDQKLDLHEAFYIGQSVRSNVVDVSDLFLGRICTVVK